MEAIPIRLQLTFNQLGYLGSLHHSYSIAWSSSDSHQEAIDPDRKRLQWVRAGHDPAIIYDPKQNTFEELTGIGIALGVNEDFRYEENIKAGVADGQIIALGTDGIWEARNKEGNMFGKKRFREIIRHNAKENAINILDAVYDGLDQHTRGLKSDDDILLWWQKFLITDCVNTGLNLSE